MTPLFACFPVLMFFAALGLLTVAIVLLGAYNRTEGTEPARQKWELTRPWIVAIVITIVVPVLMLLGIWLLPDW